MPDARDPLTTRSPRARRFPFPSFLSPVTLTPARRFRPLALGLAAGTLTFVGVMLVLLPGLLTASPARAGSATKLFMPDMHSQGYTTSTLPAGLPAGPMRLDGPAGIEGFGYSVIELTNPNDFATELTVKLDKRGRNFQNERSSLAAGASKLLRLGALSKIDDGFWNGTIEARDPVAAIVRSDWPSRGDGPSGGTLIYEAQTPATRFLAPLVVRGTDGLFSDYHIMNADDPDEERLNTVRMQFFNADDGGLESEWEDVLEPGSVINVDSAEFGTALTRLPANLPGGEFVGGFHVQAEYPIVMQMHHNEAFEGGVAAAPVRDWDQAVTEQYLPVVRANFLGDTLVGLINRENNAVDVTLRYQGASNSPNHADKEVVQQITMAPRSSASIDLGGRGMGTVGAPAITRGGRANSGFLGSARIESTGRVAASVVESSRWLTVTRSTAAWTPFTPSDLSTAFIVPAVRHAAGKRVTQLAIYNPGDGAVTAQVSYSAVEGDAAGGDPGRGARGRHSLREHRRQGGLHRARRHLGQRPRGGAGLRDTLRDAGRLRQPQQSARRLGLPGDPDRRGQRGDAEHTHGHTAPDFHRDERAAGRDPDSARTDPRRPRGRMRAGARSSCRGAMRTEPLARLAR